MATATTRKIIGPADHGRRMTLDEFIEADFREGWLYELARGVIDVTEVPELCHGRIVSRLVDLFVLYCDKNPDVIDYQSSGATCRIRLPGLHSSRRPDQAVYLDPEPNGPEPWARWVPHLVVEIVSEGGEERDYVKKREEYLRVGIREYWILDPPTRKMTVLTRAGDCWDEATVAPGAVYQTRFLPGLEVRPEELFGPADEV